MPVGIEYMFATLCSNPDEKNAMMGNHMPKSLPTMFFGKNCEEYGHVHQKVTAMPSINAEDHMPMESAAI
jgi:hypothetical protein